MKEPLISKIKRKWTEWRIDILKRIIKWAVAKVDDLEVGTFLAFSWSRDEHTAYNILAERFYDWGYVYGTKTIRYEDIVTISPAVICQV